MILFLLVGVYPLLIYLLSKILDMEFYLSAPILFYAFVCCAIIIGLIMYKGNTHILFIVEPIILIIALSFLEWQTEYSLINFAIALFTELLLFLFICKQLYALSKPTSKRLRKLILIGSLAIGVLALALFCITMPIRKGRLISKAIRQKKNFT